MIGSGATGSKKTLLYVHGRQCKPAAEPLLDLTLAALAAGIERDHPERLADFHAIDKRIAYYGHHVNALLTGSGEYFDEQLDIGDRRNALQQLRAFDRRKKFGLTAYDRLPGKSAVPELAAGVAAPLLGSIGLSNALIARVLPDIDAYWAEDSELGPAVRSSVRQVIADAMHAGEEILLLSHGTGCIVAWDVLWQLSRDERFQDLAESKVDTWITMGAPLGDSMVRRRLLGARERGRRRYPANVVSWHNVSAEDDWLSHDNTLADDYRAMLRQKQVSAIRDYRIYNLAIRYGKSDPHCSLGYLIHPRVAQLTVDWLSRSPAEPAVKHIF